MCWSFFRRSCLFLILMGVLSTTVSAQTAFLNSVPMVSSISIQSSAPTVPTPPLPSPIKKLFGEIGRSILKVVTLGHKPSTPQSLSPTTGSSSIQGTSGLSASPNPAATTGDPVALANILFLVGPNSVFLWDQPAQSLADAQSLLANLYLDGTTVGTPLGAITCQQESPVQATLFQCKVKVPLPTDVSTHSASLTVQFSGGPESLPSAVIQYKLTPSPTQVRIGN